MIELNHKTALEEITIQYIDKAILECALQEPARDYLGASILGEACNRKLQYQYFNAPVDGGKEYSPATLRIFQRGHQMESMMAVWLKKSGFTLKTQGEDGKQFGFSVVGGRIKGHIDGIVSGGPHDYSYPFLWENKALGNRSWKDLKKKKLTLSKPVYATQVAVYQAYLGLHENPALFTAVNADTMEIYIEFIPFNGELAQRASDRGVRILQACDAGELLPRIAHDPTHFECKFCPWQDRCWSEKGRLSRLPR